MLVSKYNDFVKDTIQFSDKPFEERKEIALYGLVGEIGSLVSAIKKQMLGEHGETEQFKSNPEIIEEIGDVVWYCFALSQTLHPDVKANIFTKNIAYLKHELKSEGDRSKLIKERLEKKKIDAFLKKAESFPDTKKLKFDEYQKLAILTARATDKEMLEICLTSLWQIGALLMSTFLPEKERKLAIITEESKKESFLLGDVAWYISAIASLYNLSLSKIAQENIEKNSFWSSEKKKTTPFFDQSFDDTERFPDELTIQFISIGKGTARMYCNGQQLGNDLTDNAHNEDGYRFHDALHLTNTVYLGWSPVLRSFLKKKRKSNPEIDENEDGGRAKIVEELVISAIHSEGTRLASMRGAKGQNIRLFPSESQVTVKLIKSLRNYVKNLEVNQCKAEEWVKAIYEGMKLYHQLVTEGQGTVVLDMKNRTHSFSPHVSINIRGNVLGLGTASCKYKISESCDADDQTEYSSCSDIPSEDKIALAKIAILEAILDRKPKEIEIESTNIKLLEDDQISVKAFSEVQAVIWAKKIISYKASFTISDNNISCTAIALGDPKD